MIIERTTTFLGDKDSRTVKLLFDSGATISCINSDLAHELANTIKLAKPFEVGTAAANTFMRIEEAAVFQFELEGHALYDMFVLVPGLNAEVIIGVDTLQKFHAKLDFETGAITLDANAGKLQLI
jgi:predicted aspartyl protease